MKCRAGRLQSVLPFVHEGGCQLRHGPHGQKHDAQEGHSEEGASTGCRLGNPREQGPNDERHDDDLNEPCNDQGSIPQGQGPLAPQHHLEGFVPREGVLMGCQGIGVGLAPAMRNSSQANALAVVERPC